jgi:hypothetical protein
MISASGLIMVSPCQQRVPEGPVPKIAPTSDLPSTANQGVFDLMRGGTLHPRIAWIPPTTGTGRECFHAAREMFAARGSTDLDYCDIDEEPDEGKLSGLGQYDVIYLTEGDLVSFRRGILRNEMPTRLKRYMAAGRLIVAAGGGSMQLHQERVAVLLVCRPVRRGARKPRRVRGARLRRVRNPAHLNRFDPTFPDLIMCYSERVGHDSSALADGAAMLYADSDD